MFFHFLGVGQTKARNTSREQGSELFNSTLPPHLKSPPPQSRDGYPQRGGGGRSQSDGSTPGGGGGCTTQWYNVGGNVCPAHARRATFVLSLASFLSPQICLHLGKSPK